MLYIYRVEKKTEGWVFKFIEGTTTQYHHKSLDQPAFEQYLIQNIHQNEGFQLHYNPHNYRLTQALAELDLNYIEIWHPTETSSDFSLYYHVIRLEAGDWNKRFTQGEYLIDYHNLQLAISKAQEISKYWYLCVA